MTRSQLFVIMLGVTVAATPIRALPATADAPPATALTVYARAAWDGWLRPGATTEITVSVAASKGGPLKISLHDGAATYHHRAELRADGEFIWRVPIVPGGEGKLRIDVQLPDGQKANRLLSLQTSKPGSALVAIVGANRQRLEGVPAFAIYPASRSLPVDASSYGAIDALVIERAILTRLSPRQLTALRHHIAGCGRLILLDASPGVFDVLTRHAGCGGRFVADATSADLVPTLTDLLEDSAPPLPSGAMLRMLLLDVGWMPELSILGSFLAGYLILLAFATRRPGAIRYFAGVTAAAMLIGYIAWSGKSAHVERLTWGEIESNSTTMRYASVVRIRNGGTSEASAELYGPPRPLGPTVLQMVSTPGKESATLSIHGPLWSRHDFRTTGITEVSSPLTLSIAGSEPLVRNVASHPSPEALMVWNGARYPIPRLRPGDEWRPTGDSEPWTGYGVEPFFRARSAGEAASLLIEWPSFSQPPIDIDTARLAAERAYLMVRP